ncbi:purple acid phosphatase family protein [Parapedobacter koreensis]|uniref:Purple acid Phosphatase, N-terminal domain n=1 Tax=Parapedobacter koreensis TaxID=332977 RepID=A0A1H7FRW8_9SPHI|nr:metallophosphoesterase family protein [Parapedobacter koreensis]SEK26930.1 Purple acid Phosphatase, N-terminal domain [Parapedobacter koreensis]
MKRMIQLVLLLATFQYGVAAEQPTFVVLPYLQWATQTSMDVKWETAQPTAGWVQYGPAEFDAKAPNLSLRSEASSDTVFHTVHLTGLQVSTEYFYRTVSVSQQGDTLYSDIYPFKTAVKDDEPVGFIVFTDSQGRPNPNVWGKIATVAEAERPNFAIHAGDQVDNGHRLSDWIGQFLPQGQPFMSKYAVYATLGNHERDAPAFHKYLGHPEGKRVYAVTYGNVQIILFDSNQDLSAGSENYNALEAELAKPSTAKWRIVAQHHCIYSSDNDDHGDTRVSKSTLGIHRLAHLPALYDKYNVDLVFYGHVHTYERTWPLRNNRVDNQNGTIYIQVGGNGGGLETPAPLRSWFTNKIKYGHHFGYVRAAGDELHFQAIDIDGQVFDQLELRKGDR